VGHRRRNRGHRTCRDDAMKSPEWHANPWTPHERVFGRLLEDGDVICGGDLVATETAWIPSSLAGVPVTKHTRSTYVRPT
jgi:hypothetical protein